MGSKVWLAVAISVMLTLTACGGGGSQDAFTPATVPQAVVKAAKPTGAGATAVHMYQALYGKAPSYALMTDYMAQATSDASAFALNLASAFSSTSHADLAKLVLSNLGVTAATVPATNATGQSEYALLLDAVQQIFAAFPTMRGQVILNMTNLLEGLEADATYGAAAIAYNSQASVNLTYSMNTTNTTPASVTGISGIVSDDAVAGATVTATALDSGLVLGTAVTGADGNYALSTPTTAIGTGYNLSSSGGTMNGAVFGGNLSATYTGTHPSQSANLTLITTSLVEAANTTTKYTGSYQQKHAAILADAIQRGVLPTNYYAVDTGALTATMRIQTATLGLAAAITGLSQNVSAGLRTVSGCGSSDQKCVVDVSSALGSRSISFKGATVTAPVGNCLVVVTHDVTRQSMTVQFENIADGSTIAAQCTPTGNITLTLPDPPSEVPDACLPTGSIAAPMSHCVTIGSGFQPNYLAKVGGYNHRSNMNPFSVPAAFGVPIELSRSYGAVLHASQVPYSGLAANQWVGKTPVIFVHGYTRGAGFGGDADTWGALPALVLEDTSFVALNFQWRSDASYLTVAKELAKAVDYAYLSTGKKVHIVAHSFGGVLSRVMLQSLAGTTDGSAAKVATLTTIGTPHSGIVDNTGLLTGTYRTSDGVVLPHGWGSVPFDKFCGQTSCFESGLSANVAPWALTELGKTQNDYGYITAQLALTKQNLPLGLTVLVLMGLVFDPAPGSAMFSNSDGLITYRGQRFSPELLNGDLLQNATVGGATVTERILGLNPGVKATPNTLVGSIYVSPSASVGWLGKYFGLPVNAGGYQHTAVSVITGGIEVLGAKPEVKIDCASAASCTHDTWLRLHAFLQDNPATCIAPQVLQNGFCVAATVPSPSITSVNPATTIAGTATTFTVTGQNLPLTAVMSLAEGSCQASTGQTATGFAVVCTPGSAAGSKAVIISTAAVSGTIIDASKTIALTLAVTATITPLTDTGIAANQCYVSGGSLLVDCKGAVVFNSQQDGMVGRDVTSPDNTDGKLGFSYSIVGSNPITDCVKDNVTGLMWEGKPTTGPRASANTYTNYGDGRTGDASAYVTSVNTTGLCGFTDWRLPTRHELQSLIDYGTSAGPSLDANWFPNTQTNYYWASSSWATDITQAWQANFSSGYVGYMYRRYGYNVRLIR